MAEIETPRSVDVNFDSLDAHKDDMEKTGSMTARSLTVTPREREKFLDTILHKQKIETPGFGSFYEHKESPGPAHYNVKEGMGHSMVTKLASPSFSIGHRNGPKTTDIAKNCRPYFQQRDKLAKELNQSSHNFYPSSSLGSQVLSKNKSCQSTSFSKANIRNHPEKMPPFMGPDFQHENLGFHGPGRFYGEEKSQKKSKTSWSQSRRF